MTKLRLSKIVNIHQAQAHHQSGWLGEAWARPRGEAKGEAIGNSAIAQHERTRNETAQS